MTLDEATASLLAALRTVPGLAADTADHLGQVSLPVVLVGVPSLAWDTWGPDPSDATFAVTLLVRLDGTAITSLYRYLAAVAAALETGTSAAISAATPLSYDLGAGVTAAAYELTVEMPLGGPPR